MSSEAMQTADNSDLQELSENASQFLTFNVDNEEYGVNIMEVREIRAWGEATRLPNAPAYLRGVINLRGLIIPIFDLRARFSGKITDATAKHVVIIIAVQERIIGVLVDAVSDILDVEQDDIRPTPSVDGEKDEFIKGLISLEQRMVVLLDIELLFNNEEVLEHIPASDKELEA